MPEIAYTRRGPAFPWHYAASGTSASWVGLWSAITIGYSMADPTAIVPPDDTIPGDAIAHTVVDPSTYTGPVGGQIGAPTCNTYRYKWHLLTYAGAGKLYLMREDEIDNLDAWLTQPTKTIPGTPPITVPAPYGTNSKNWCILATVYSTHFDDKETQA